MGYGDADGRRGGASWNGPGPARGGYQGPDPRWHGGNQGQWGQPPARGGYQGPDPRWHGGNQGQWGPNGTRVLRLPDPSDRRDPGRGPGAGVNASPGRAPGASGGAPPWEDGHGRGSRMSRRVVLAALGGLLITGTAAAAEAAVNRGHSGAGGGPHPAAGGATTAKRHGGAPGRPGNGSPAGPHGHARPQGGGTPAKPVYYVHDGPKTVALTIDDGPNPVYTPQILQVLARYGVTATFSMVGQSVASYPAIAREVAAAGHAIANHTWSHADLAAESASAVRDEITRASDIIHTATGRQPTVFRAPYGAWSPVLLDYCAAQGLTPLDWSVDPRDWARPGVTSIVANILATTRTGSIILEHDGGGDRSQTVAALKIVLPRLLDEGYRFRQV
jgi:peptidoglycan/xylan/chitin deacetylase (PgdA/CDA1 family)